MSAAPEPAALSHRETFALIVRAIRVIWPLRRRVAVKICLSMVGFLPTLVMPWPTKMLIDQVILGTDVRTQPNAYPFFMLPLVAAFEGASRAQIAWWVLAFMALSLLLLGAWSVEGRDIAYEDPSSGRDTATSSEQAANYSYSYAGGLAGWFEYRWTLRLTQAFNHLFRARVFEALQRLPMTALDNQRIGDGIYRVMYDTPSISEVCYRGMVAPITVPIQVGLAVWLLAFTYRNVPVIAWLVIALIPIMLLITFPFSGALRRRAEAARVAGATTTTTMEEAQHNILAVQSLGAQQRERARFDADSRGSFDQYRRWYMLNAVMIATAIASGIALGAVAYFQLTDLVFAGRITVGDLGAVISLYATVAYTASQFAIIWIMLQKNAAGLRRVFAILDLPGDHQPQNPKPLPPLRKGYRFEGVGFRYPDGMHALRDVSFSAERGQVLALVGPAGAGKTSLAYMFPRFLWPTEGRILIDDVELTQIDRDALRAQVSFVFQEPVLINATVAENIRIAKPDATDAELRRAAELAGVLDVIERLPQGFDTPLGRNGGRLSVGQKQRLSIARALVRDAPVLVLDEPTAALDPETEQQLVRTLREAARDKLVVVIAHRLSTIRHADKIIFLEDGQIVEQGTHAALMERASGAYHRFVMLQSAEPS
jgi:ABC-type multidrug transport system fused ATPase/permease subunit